MRNLLGCFSVCWVLFASTTAVSFAQKPHSYVADANREYGAIFSHPENPCATKQNTASYADCIGKEVSFVEAHLSNLLTAIRGIASQDDAGAAVNSSARGMSELALVNKADSSWHQYRTSICDLAAAGMAGGSGEGNAISECVFKIDRVHARQMADAVYLHTLAE